MKKDKAIVVKTDGARMRQQEKKYLWFQIQGFDPKEMQGFILETARRYVQYDASAAETDYLAPMFVTGCSH